jgi:hypothetical protein
MRVDPASMAESLRPISICYSSKSSQGGVTETEAIPSSLSSHSHSPLPVS